MEIGISGHTSGIGKSLFKIFPDSLGFSRSNGYDLNDKIIRERMYDEIDSCGIFINNAPIGWNQISLLYELWERWKTKDRIIVNIGSDAADYNHSSSRPYSVQKRALQDACLQLQQSFLPCKTILIKPGYVNTPRVQQINAIKMDPDEVALYIKELVELKNTTFWIPIVTLYPR